MYEQTRDSDIGESNFNIATKPGGRKPARPLDIEWTGGGSGNYPATENLLRNVE